LLPCFTFFHGPFLFRSVICSIYFSLTSLFLFQRLVFYIFFSLAYFSVERIVSFTRCRHNCLLVFFWYRSQFFSLALSISLIFIRSLTLLFSMTRSLSHFHLFITHSLAQSLSLYAISLHQSLVQSICLFFHSLYLSLLFSFSFNRILTLLSKVFSGFLPCCFSFHSIYFSLFTLTTSDSIISLWVYFTHSSLVILSLSLSFIRSNFQLLVAPFLVFRFTLSRCFFKSRSHSLFHSLTRSITSPNSH